MTRIIQLTNTDHNIADRLALAAWQFAHAVLWAEQPLSDQEQERAAALVRQSLNYPAITESSFICFCERILLAREAQLTGQSSYFAQPSVWLHPGYAEGYMTTKNNYEQLLQKRSEVPGYRIEYNILAFGYYKYQRRLRHSTFSLCRRKLLHHKAFGLLTLLYRAVIYCKFPQQ